MFSASLAPGPRAKRTGNLLPHTSPQRAHPPEGPGGDPRCQAWGGRSPQSRPEAPAKGAEGRLWGLRAPAPPGGGPGVGSVGGLGGVGGRQTPHTGPKERELP